MTQCKQCKKRNVNHWHVTVEAGELARYCDDCWHGVPEEPVLILKDKAGIRAAHWNEIRTRVTTHEGELLHGRAGETYQKKWAGKYLGREIGSSRPITADRVKEYEKTKR